MNFTLLLSALRARSQVFFMILAATVAATIIVSVLMPKTYVAKVSLLVDGKDEQSLRSGQALPERERTGYLQTQIDILTSPKVAQRVVRDLKLADNRGALADIGADDSSQAAGGNGSLEEYVTEVLRKRLKVDTSQSSVIQMTFAAANPVLAAQIANGFAKAYVDTALDLRIEPTRQASSWFKDQLKGLRDNLEQAEQRLAAFRQEHGVANMDERYDVDSIQLSDLAGMVGRAREPASGTTVDVSSNASIQGLRADLRRAEAKLQQMSAELGDKHPQYLRQLAEVQSLRNTVASETQNAIAGAEEATQRYRQRRDRLSAEMEAQRARVLALTQARTQMSVLSHDVAIAQRTYDDAMQRYMTSNIDSRALQTNISVLDAASPPLLPARPRLLLNIGIALVIGSLLGLAAVHLMEMFDHRVRLIEDLAGDAQVPLLAVLDKWNPMADRLPAPAIRHALPGPG
ncbi:MAG: GNVR domain-containing protein [Rhodocyclaceae bacterium]|nr:GNVR domain-containing protein [Rhodocyclaceae bacterium]